MTSLVQKKLFKGTQRIEITEDDQLLFASKGMGNEKNLSFPLAQFDPKPARVKTNAWTYLASAILTGTYLLVFLVVLSRSKVSLKRVTPCARLASKRRGIRCGRDGLFFFPG